MLIHTGAVLFKSVSVSFCPVLRYTFLKQLDACIRPLITYFFKDCNTQSCLNVAFFHGKKGFHFIKSQKFAIFDGSSVNFITF